ncbi:hypothetical protein HPB52_022983 [Rhipicephalus sanguineus]|uniref:Uncharacterized protein n=1 Tax=Rhipicephalus sanguineus TaxID=34632 RepID=A0A9D4PQH1_RHISA|nr:hypothetical protein HPB52_022983 [Rhipicephalus sanguineus]
MHLYKDKPAPSVCNRSVMRRVHTMQNDRGNSAPLDCNSVCDRLRFASDVSRILDRVVSVLRTLASLSPGRCNHLSSAVLANRLSPKERCPGPRCQTASFTRPSRRICPRSTRPASGWYHTGYYSCGSAASCTGDNSEL